MSSNPSMPIERVVPPESLKSGTSSQRRVRILFMPREPFPTDRVRINVLFGRELPSRGHQVDLAAQAADDAAPPGPREWHGGTLFLGKTDSGKSILHRVRRHVLGLAHDIRCLLRVRRADYDAVVVSDKFLSASIGVVVARARKVKFIFWLTFPISEADLASARDGSARYPWVARARGRGGAWLLHKWIMPRCDHVFVQSDRMKRDVCAHGFDPRRVSPILTGFGLTQIDAVKRAARRTDSSVATLAYLGTLSASRRLEFLIDMTGLLHRAGMRVKLLLIGDGDRPSDRSLLEQRAQREGVAEHVEITGFLPQAEALRRVFEAQICLSPIHRSPILDVGSPTKLVEYLALAMPVVANDHPEQRLMLRECRAGVCVPWGARHFARAVRWLLARTPEELAAMGARGRKYVEQHRTYARIADDVERTLIQVVTADAPIRIQAHD
jgi:glycosyltransferase involved in cell wall biosynthesis